MTGIHDLSSNLIRTTLEQSYIGEQIPTVWLNFERNIKLLSATKSLVPYKEVVELAESSSLFDPDEILQAVRFLNDLGSLQYFETTMLKENVVINCQWLVDVMACVVSVNKTCIEAGMLRHEDVGQIWSDYEPALHAWMLLCCEEFDLTFPVPEREISIVPCLLPDSEPTIDWPELNSTKLKELKIVYSFAYVPAGLFNRIQVRLFNYADSSRIWQKGSLLIKNQHQALITELKSLRIQVKVRGVKPENVVFIIHEVIETLINEFYQGLDYDYSFPCPECVDEHKSDPCLFSSTLLRRATDFKAPFLQCNKYFHAISIQEMLAVMPIDNTASLDLNLEYSLRDLKRLKRVLKYDIVFWYCHKDLKRKYSCISPMKIISEIESKCEYKIWHSEKPRDEKLDQLTYVIKDSKLVVLFVSDQFTQDDKSLKIFELTRNVLKKNYLLLEVGLTHDWLKKSAFASVCSDKVNLFYEFSLALLK